MIRPVNYIKLEKRIAALAMASVLAFSFCSCSGSSGTVTHTTLSSSELEELAIKRNNQKVHTYTNKMLGFELPDEYIAEAELMMNTPDANSSGNVAILVAAGKENDLLALLNSKLGREKNIGPNMIPKELDNQYAFELRRMNPIKMWTVSGPGNQTVSVYMARKGNYSYVFMFG